MSLNTVALVGRLANDPDLRYTPNGKAVANFRLAVQRTYKDQNGDYQADFLNCVIWNKPAENLAQYMNKGSQVGVTGSLQSRSYENNQGQRVYVTEVVVNNATFLESKKNNQRNNNQSGNSYQNQGNPYQNNQYQGNPYQNQNQNQGNPYQGGGQFEPIDISDDELPF